MVIQYFQAINLAFFSSFDNSAKHVKIQTCPYRPFSVVVKDIAISVGGSPPLRCFFFFFQDSKLCCMGA